MPSPAGHISIPGNAVKNQFIGSQTSGQRGQHIPVIGKEEIAKFKPDYVLILPWNLKKEIGEQLSFIRDWGGKFVIFIPELLIF